MSRNRALQVLDGLRKSGGGQGIEEIEHERLGRELVRTSIHAHGRYVRSSRGGDIAQCDIVQFRQKFHADDTSKSKFGGHQESSSLAGTDVDEGERFKVYVQRFKHFTKQHWLGW